MKLIVGLGNPGDKYAGTRHNIGFSVIVNLADRYNVGMSESKQKAAVGKCVIGGEKVLLAMPQTYMNLSGDSVRALADYYHLEPEEILVVYDDINLDVGKLRMRAGGSAGGHNGMKDIIAKLGTQDYPRLRLGVGAKPSGMDLADYVLGRFPKDELPLVRETVDRAADAVECFIKEDVETAMNRFNG